MILYNDFPENCENEYLILKMVAQTTPLWKKVVFPPNTEWWTKPLSEWFMKLKS